MSNITILTDISKRLSITSSITIDITNVPHTNISTFNYGDGVNSLTYTPIGDNTLVIQLYRKIINKVKLEKGDVDYWEKISIPNNLNVESDYGYQCNIITGNTLSIFLVDTFTARRNIPIERQFDIDTVYLIKFDIENIQSSYEFITELTSDTQSQDETPQNNINALYKLDNFLDLRNISLISNSTNIKFDHTFKSAATNTVIPYKVSTITEDLLVSELLPDFVKFFNTIELDIEQNVTDITTQNERYLKLQKVKTSLLQNAHLINSGVRGTLSGIRFIFELFVDNLSEYFFVNVEPSPSGIPFVYRITSSLPKSIWYAIIRPIVHPISWYDDYVYINISDSTSNTNIVDNNIISNSKLYKEIYQLDKISYSFLDCNNNLKNYNTQFNVSNLCSLDNLISGYRYTYTDSQYMCIMSALDFNDCVADVSYRLLVSNKMLYLTIIPYDTQLNSYLNVYSDLDDIPSFKILITDGIRSITDADTQLEQPYNNFLTDSVTLEMYVLSYDIIIYLQSISHSELLATDFIV